MTSRGSNLDSNLHDQQVVKVYSLLNHYKNCEEFKFFSSPLLMPSLGQVK